MEEEERFPPLSSSFVLKDISNFKTPKRIPKNPQFFTACNETPRSSSSFRYRSQPSLVPSSSRSKAKAKLKAFQLERSQSACKEQLKKDRSLKSLAKSLTAWLNFLFQNPELCGCDLSINGCNESNVVRVDSAWRSPKRMRELWWRGEESENVVADVSSLKYSSLRSSLKEVCSFDELKQRMQVYLSLVSCKEVFNVMTQAAKNIDGGRLKMKANCPIVTDVGVKEKATKILMSYNPIWLRIGLYIIFGGDSLISPEGDFSSVKDISFLKMIIEKQFFSHTGLAKAYAYNKKVEGLYRPGYYENLGNIILKRTLLLVLILDRAKSQTSLPLNYGIDGVDGGSPLLFTVSSGIKSSRQVLHNFLSSDVMQGEGDLLAHLVIVGYKVSHQQDSHETRDEKSIMSTTDYTDAVHNFVLSQKLTAILGKFPEVMLLELRTKSAIIIQSHARGWIAKRETYRQKHCIVVIQSRGWLVRKDVLLRRDAVIKIQRAIRSLICQKAFHLQKLAAIDIQMGQIARSRLLGATSAQAAGGGACNCNMSGGFVRRFELTLVIISVLKLQRWWRGVLLLKSTARSVIIIQTHARGWIARQKAYRKRTCIVVVQSYWKGYVARKESREQLLNLRLRMQKSAMNVDDSRRLINRLLSALSELLSMKSIRGILHNCETLDMATAHSLKCCEELVAAGAITILLKLIRAASRSIPDQQVLKHALSTLRNLARYPHLTQVLIDSPASVETILWELHRNKEEGYFIASQILKKICSNENGVITVHKFPALLKRLYNLVEELTRKAYNEKRNPRAVAVRDNTDRRRLKEPWNFLN
uniref:Calponin-homology (CH) domain-containing protein n=1 Tax=Gossypium raimondii TaxID=29730 RepID=A0A0D2UMQ0_GOSRA|nr:hypothetical protein B456_011G015400 [Gossypium raimondii]